MRPKQDLFLVVYNNHKTFKSGLRKIITIQNDEKHMTFLDKDVVYIDGLLDIGSIKEITMTVTA